MPSGPTIILALKVAVSAVTLLLLLSLVALARGNYRLHGRINLAFFILTVGAVITFETLLQLGADVKSHMTAFERAALNVHLCFAGPLPLVMGVMLYTGLKHHRRVHIALSILFSILWIGTFITGIFFLPHSAP
jgi:uncharacterized membrane protein YozB (DUF420 family)